jgi:hypothetical protein
MLQIFLIMIFAFTLNLPFGYLRSRARKYSLKWFLYIHIPVPIVIAARILSGAGYKFIPLIIIAAVAGQFCGGRIEASNAHKLSNKT